MSEFTTSVVLEPLTDGRWRLASPLIWEVGRKDSGLIFRIPEGFITDLASIPTFARMLFDRGDARFAKAAILHDAMLNDREWSRVTASAEFYGALLASGAPVWRSRIMAVSVLLWTTR